VAYTVSFTRRADRDYSDVPDGLLGELDGILDSFPSEPFPEGCRKLRGYDRLWRVRFGKSWRMIYHVDGKAREITIARIFPRRLGYERALRGLK